MVSLKEQELLTIPEHRSSPSIVKRRSCCSIFRFLRTVLGIIVLLTFSFRPLCDLDLSFDSRFFITPYGIFKCFRYGNRVEHKVHVNKTNVPLAYKSVPMRIISYCMYIAFCLFHTNGINKQSAISIQERTNASHLILYCILFASY